MLPEHSIYKTLILPYRRIRNAGKKFVQKPVLLFINLPGLEKVVQFGLRIEKKGIYERRFRDRCDEEQK
ncbi:MAG TPA: hypothetical protein ENO22_08945 [candidate division Zixibacteria bacterium]|nr:hypothetical protein [candidate division Zixibacteria bacterium]